MSNGYWSTPWGPQRPQTPGGPFEGRTHGDLINAMNFASAAQAQGKRDAAWEQGVKLLAGLTGLEGMGYGGGGAGGLWNPFGSQQMQRAAEHSLLGLLQPSPIPNQFTSQVARQMGGIGKETVAAQYAERERQLREALRNRSISQGDYIALMGELQRNRVAAEQEAYRTPAIEQARQAAEFALRERESGISGQNVALAALQSILGHQMSARTNLAQMLGQAPYQGTDYSGLAGLGGGWGINPLLIAALQGMGGGGIRGIRGLGG